MFYYFSAVHCIFHQTALYYIYGTNTPKISTKFVTRWKIIEIEIKRSNRIKDYFHRLCNKAEDHLIFNTIEKIPENLLPAPLMNWMVKYIQKRIAELNQQIIRDRWKQVEYEKVTQHIRQQDIK